ncbi:hypothetical protein Pst134EB_001495 [Puccinia striiformis f. sp. tritici]|nr:hypothetical protein Pst134EB_001495 [Puccinia striiformis f. sp. tritici]
MLSFGWILSAVVALTLQQSSLAWSAASHGDTPHHLQKRYRIVGQPPPPCMHKICPLASRSEVPIDATVESDVSAKSNRGTPSSSQYTSPAVVNAKPNIPGTHQTAPINCGDGTQPPCGQTRPGSETTRFPGTHQTAPVACGDGTPPPCGQMKPVVTFPGTHITAPVSCGDGKKPPCGPAKTAPEVSHIPGTHQTAPINCGDGIKPPCGQAQPVTTPQRTPSDCGDGTGGPCVVIDPGREPPHADLLPKQTTASTNPNYHKTPQPASTNCGDHTNTPCHPASLETRQAQNATSFVLPRPRQTAPVHCGDGTTPPCHESSSQTDQ